MLREHFRPRFGRPLRASGSTPPGPAGPSQRTLYPRPHALRAPAAAMSHHSSIQRTAPIAIAPKPPRPEPASAYRHDSFHRLDPGSSGSLPNSPGPPCRACRYSRANCVMSDDEDSCIPCQVSGSECSLASSPQSRKRKLHGVESADDIIGKRRSVQPAQLDIFPTLLPSHVLPFPCSPSSGLPLALLAPAHCRRVPLFPIHQP